MEFLELKNAPTEVKTQWISSITEWKDEIDNLSGPVTIKEIKFII